MHSNILLLWFPKNNFRLLNTIQKYDKCMNGFDLMQHLKIFVHDSTLIVIKLMTISLFAPPQLNQSLSFFKIIGNLNHLNYLHFKDQKNK